jgi:site-specific DNA-methyltransferase (adenine-specific)
MEIFNNDCLDEMKNIKDNSIDLVFCDLPYGVTSCAWDCKIDLEKFWIEMMRIKKLNTPLFFTTTTKFDVDLIQSAPKKCFFRYDLVWVKSAPAGFLCAKKMPMRKHEMIYVFYEKLPFYDLSSHTHKFIKETINKRNDKDGINNKGMIKNRSKTEISNKYDPPLPVSVIKVRKPVKAGEHIYGDSVTSPIGKYDPPLPVSVVKEENNDKSKNIYGENANWGKKNYTSKERASTVYDPPLPTSMLEVKSTRGKHSTEKPVALMEWILKYYSKEGDLILDPTMGSGSTGVSCQNMNRRFIGIEKDEEIFKVAQKRLIDKS